jgi:serine/threonine-protein kinase
MELLSGVTLLELVEQGGARPAKEAAEYIRQIASGLDKAHGHVDRDGKRSPIVHRDLKPANVFVTSRDDGSALLKILDFGTAKMLSANAPSSRIVRGTPQYMAPEQLAGDPATPATDIWALGLVAFFVLTGRSYWTSVAKQASAEALFGEIYTLPLAPASERARAVGSKATLAPAFDAWFARCVNRNAEARFQSAGAAARELANALGGTLVAAPPIAVSSGATRVATAPHSEEREVVPSTGEERSSTERHATLGRRPRARALLSLLVGLVLTGAAVALVVERLHAGKASPATSSHTEAAPVLPANTASASSSAAGPGDRPATFPSAGAAPATTMSAMVTPETLRPKAPKQRRTVKTKTPEAPAQPASAPAPSVKDRPNVYEIR